MKPLKIYLGDLTYTTLSLATEAFPLNIGYVGAYCEKVFGDQVEITLFKYVYDLELAIHESAPDILALSNYPWNHALDLELFDMMHGIRPETMCVMGGSNIDHQPHQQAGFMKAKPMIDIYVYLEGEIGFSNIVGEILNGSEQGLDRARLKKEPIPGCLFIDAQGEFVRGPAIPRQRSMDEYPSPYLTGLMDKFFDGKLSPMLETNRGCPFSCSFCHEGHSTFQKVNFFSMERVIAELEYVAQRVKEPVHNLMFCDPNFGMYHRDVEICESIAAIQAKTGWPKDIFATTGKNNKERIAQSLYELNGTMQMWLSVQSLDETVLENIKRTNISLDDMMHLQDSLTANKLPSMSEIILGLPGETYESHIKSISSLVMAGVDFISAYTLMLLSGTEMNSPEQREKWGFKTKFRILPRDFGKLANGRNVIEVEEVAVGTKTMSFEEYLALRRYHLIISVIYNGKPFAALFKLLRELDLDAFLFLKDVIERVSEAPASVQELMADFEDETKNELWESEQELREFYSHDVNYDRLVSGELGSNLLQKYISISLSEAPEHWAEYVFLVAQDFASKQINNSEPSVLEKLDNINRYCTARVRNLFDPDRLTVIPEEVLGYDIEEWVEDLSGRSLEELTYDSPRRMKFMFTDEQYKVTEDYIARFGRTQQGIGKIFTKMNIMNAWRKCVPFDSEIGDDSEQPRTFYALVEEQASGGPTARPQ